MADSTPQLYDIEYDPEDLIFPEIPFAPPSSLRFQEEYTTEVIQRVKIHSRRLFQDWDQQLENDIGSSWLYLQEYPGSIEELQKCQTG